MAVIHGFERLREQDVPELKTRAELFRHVKTGAELLFERVDLLLQLGRSLGSLGVNLLRRGGIVLSMLPLTIRLLVGLLLVHLHLPTG